MKLTGPLDDLQEQLEPLIGCQASHEEEVVLATLIIARPERIEVEVDGAVTWREFDVVWAFDSEEEARAYAEMEGIKDVEI